jgi:transcriptional regulator CtsR
MDEIDSNRYDYLRRKRYEVHEEHEQFIRPETLAEMRQYEVIEFYSRQRIRELSQNGLILEELKRLIDELLRLRQEHAEGSNQECIRMDMITELISKLDLEDFRTLRIERIIDDPNA